MASVKEQSVAYLTVSFYDKNNALAAPTSATWKVHDLQSGTELLASTAILPIASSVELTLTTAINTLVDSNHQEETRRVTIESVTADGEVNDEYDYDVLSLEHVT